jgi:hypothetical protein
MTREEVDAILRKAANPENIAESMGAHCREKAGAAEIFLARYDKLKNAQKRMEAWDRVEFYARLVEQDLK